MSVALFAALLWAWVIGTMVTIVLWPRARRVSADLPIIAPLGLLVGHGVTSGLFFFGSLVSARQARTTIILETALVLVLWGVLARRQPSAPTMATVFTQRIRWLQLIVLSIFVQAVVVAVIAAHRAYGAEPFGGWDGWAIWNMHARFMHRAGTSWPELLAAPQLSWTHPDYPRLVSGSVARAWAWAGESSSAAGAVSFSFGAATVSLLVGAVSRLRDATLGFVGGLLLLGTPFFVVFSANQHADVPLGSYMLAALVLVILGERSPGHAGTWALAGTVTAMAVCTKNEGMLFAAAFGLLAAQRAWRAGGVRALITFLGALAVAATPALVFKLGYAPPNDLVAGPWLPRFVQLIDPARHGLIATSAWRDLRGFGEWSLVPFAAMAVPFVAWRARGHLSRVERIIPYLIGLMLLGYYAVYLLSPHDLTWHLNTSLVRLFVQLWPVVLFGWCFTVPAPEPIVDRVQSSQIRMPILLGANVLCAAVILFLLSRMLAANELADYRGGGTRIVAVLDEGWHGREQAGANIWAWSAERAVLRLETESRAAVETNVTLRFSLRSLSGGTIVVRMNDQIVWQGKVGGDFTPVEIRDLALPPGAATLEFTTDSPGIPEAPHPGARQLAFAVYNLELR